MKTLITAAQVVAQAFGDGEYLAPEVVGEADIAAAEHVWIEPVVGARLYAKLLEGEYASLVEEYVAPALAMAVRVVLQPALNERTGQTGLVIPSTPYAETASAASATALMASLRRRRQMLLRRLSDHLSNNDTLYPEYDAVGDVVKHCYRDGGFIQVL